MTAPMWPFVAVYALISMGWLLCCSHDARYSRTYAEERRLARYALASPLWPLLLLWAFGKGLLWLWRAADFGRAS